MKKMFLALMLLAGIFCCVQVSAGPNEDFDAFVTATRNSPTNPPGMQVSADRARRIIYVTFPLQVQSSQLTPAILAQMKQAMISQFKNAQPDRDIIKRLGITVIYRFNTMDNRTVQIRILASEI